LQNADRHTYLEFAVMLKKVLSCLAIVLVAGATVVAGDVDLKGVKCVVIPKAAKISKSADYRDGKVYFCCGNCAGKFAANQKRYAIKANHQLVASGQYEQIGCPMSGGKLNPSTTIKVAGVDVAFCCNGCKGKVESAADDADKLKMVFADKAFEKAFKKKTNTGR
jgi:hypothetical protein